MCATVFVGGGYFYLEKNIIGADTETEKIPYYTQNPENAGILIKCGGEEVFVYLDFFSERVCVALDFEYFSEELYGYTIDYTVEGNQIFTEEILDYFGGINLKTENESIRYTGKQINETLKRTNSLELRKEIIRAVSDYIIENGIDNTFYHAIVQNSNSDLEISECYFWYEKLPQICRNLIFIDA